MASFECEECGALLRLPRSVSTLRCHRCGEVYLAWDDEWHRSYPSLHMMPIDHVAPDGMQAQSVWMPTDTRPLVQGCYDCRFRHTEPAIVRLHWDGVTFVYEGQRVDMTQFLTWRGMLG